MPAQPHLPTSVVHEVMMTTAEREQVREVGGAAVPPPTDVVDGAVVERDIAPGHRTPAVQSAQCPTLCSAGEAGGSAEVEGARRLDHHTVAHDHPVGARAGIGCQCVEDALWDVDGKAPVDVG